ncbi:MAG: T9SS type A sorting domain-containing protein [bacterium]
MQEWLIWGADGEDVRVGDFNGDGKDDLLWVDKHNKHIGDTDPDEAGLHVTLSSGSGFQKESLWSSWGGLENSFGYYMGDFNGDGCDDFLNLSSAFDLEVVLSNGAGFSQLQNWGNWGADGEDILIGNFDATADVVTSVENGDVDRRTIPKEFRLEQNYPNPFNPTTTIQFALPKPCKVTLKLYDILGRDVATLVDEEFEPGEYKVVFDAQGLASGVYFYRIQAGGFIKTKKLLLLK